MRRHFGLALAVVLFALNCAVAANTAKTNIVTSTSDLAALAQEVGGDRVTVQAIAKGYQDPHFVEAKPSFLLLLRRADLLIVVGMQLESGWIPPLISQCGNPKIQGPGASGYLDASQFAKILEIPTGQITRAMGDVHPQGNPHYWLDPENGRRIAHGIQMKLAEMDPANSAYFEQRFRDFARRLDDAEKRWDAQMLPFQGRRVVTYHRSWPNFADRFHLEVIGYVEPRPGIPPSPSHTFDLIQAMKRDNIKSILVEPYFDLKTPESVARATGGQVLVLAPSVGGEKGTEDYFKLFDYNVALLTKAFQSTR